jgi:hypothetical protein
VDASTLAGNDVVIVPGGNAYDFEMNPANSRQAILDFVESGHGYYGTCAGGYVACVDSVYTDRDGVETVYPDWGISPTVHCFLNHDSVTAEAKVPVLVTPEGEEVLGMSGEVHTCTHAPRPNALPPPHSSIRWS